MPPLPTQPGGGACLCLVWMQSVLPSHVVRREPNPGRGHEGKQGQLDEVQYGTRRILIEAAHYSYLAVVVDGVEPPGFRSAMR